MLKSFFSKSYIVAIAICCTVALVTSCEDTEEAIRVEGVSMSDPQLVLIEGQSQLLKVNFVPENASNKKVVWDSEDDGVATVNENGEVTAISAGETTVTATTEDGGKVATCEVSVKKTIVSVTGVSLSETTLSMMVGENTTLTAIIEPEQATVKDVTWLSEDETVAKVTDGEVEAVSVGATRIKVTTLDGGKTAYCNVTVDASEFTVTFETNGGNDIADVIVPKAGLLTPPADPTKPGGPSEGLYLGIIDSDAGSFVFDGWYTDVALTASYNFSTPVTTNLTLYAKWSTVGTLPTPIDVSAATGGNIVEKSYMYLHGLTSLSTSTEYTLLLTSDVSVSYGFPNFNNENVSLLFLGKGEERVIRKTSTGNLFLIEAGTFILGNNIKLTGSAMANYAVVYLSKTGAVVMKEGSKISDAVGTGNAVAVFVNDGTATFTMEGGEISNNKVTRATAGIAAGAVCVSWGKFYMKGGVISGNSVTTPFNANNVAGGVYINNYNSMDKTGGEIKDNTAEITAAEVGAGRTGQQVFYSHNNGDATTWRKVDANLGATDDLSTGARDNLPWQVVE